MPEVKKLKCSPKTKTLMKLAEDLKAELGAEVVCDEKLLNNKSVLLCLEQYYFRCNNYVALSVMMVENDDCQEVVLAGFAGGDDIFGECFAAHGAPGSSGGVGDESDAAEIAELEEEFRGGSADAIVVVHDEKRFVLLHADFIA